MENIRPILYGVADYAQIRKKNAWFVDRTAKIRHLITADRRLNGNFHVLENLLAGGSLSERLVKLFQARELSQKENFTSLLYWLGITTITGGRFGKMEFGVPNETLKELAAKILPAAYADVHKIEEV